jgi:hypothetical protein
MADEKAKATEPEPAQAKPSSRLAAIRRSLLAKWLPIVIVGSVVAHGLLWSLRGGGAGESAKPVGEITLGKFHFTDHPGSLSAISGADFQLHISLLKDLDSQARARLNERKFKVQQDVEELLRQAHGGDFDDPELNELKRQLQEQINASLELRAISEIIITDLFVDRQAEEATVSTSGPPTSPTSPISAEMVPPAGWEEKPAG